MICTNRARGILSTALIALAAATGGLRPATAHGQDLSNLDKGHRLLIQNGLQVIGLVTTSDPFHLATYQNANYTSILWWADSDPSAAPNTPWVRSVFDQSNMPHLVPSENGAYLSKLVGVSLGDEQNLN